MCWSRDGSWSWLDGLTLYSQSMDNESRNEHRLHCSGCSRTPNRGRETERDPGRIPRNPKESRLTGAWEIERYLKRGAGKAWAWHKMLTALSSWRRNNDMEASLETRGVVALVGSDQSGIHLFFVYFVWFFSLSFLSFTGDFLTHLSGWFSFEKMIQIRKWNVV